MPAASGLRGWCPYTIEVSSSVIPAASAVKRFVEVSAGILGALMLTRLTSTAPAEEPPC
jgi:hypothetical protein